MEAVHFKQKGLRQRIAQPTDDIDREPLAGYHYSAPFPTATVSYSDIDNFVINIPHHHSKQVGFEKDSSVGKNTSTANVSVITILSEDDSSLVVDMGHGTSEQTPANIENLVTSVREAGLSERDYNINWRENHRFSKDLSDLQIVEQPFELTKKRGYVIPGDEKDLCRLINEQPTVPHTVDKGVICNSQVLCTENGDYNEGQQYQVFPDTESKGAFGEAAMCEDKKTGRTFIRKRVHGQLSKNEVTVPAMFRGYAGFPEIYGVISRGQTTEIFQEFAGLSLKKLCESDYAAQFQDPGMLLGLAFQGFASLDKLHSKDIQHLDIKPENICVDMGQKAPRLKFIDYGTSQMPGEVVTGGMTIEYLSPESCLSILKVATGQQSKGRLGSGTDVWATSLSLLYCLRGYHVMVYMCTGDVAYPKLQPDELERKRIECLPKISKMTDSDMARLIHPKWPQVLKTLLTNTLRVNPDHRWSAGQAASFILEYLKTVAQRSSAPVVAASSRGSAFAPSGLQVRVHTAQMEQKKPASTMYPRSS